MFNYHLYDGFLQAKTNMNRALADNSELAEVLNYTESIKRPVNEEMTGLQKERMCLLFHLNLLRTL